MHLCCRRTDSEDPQVLLRQSVVRILASRKILKGPQWDPGYGRRDLLRYFVDSGRYSQRELANLLSLSRVTAEEADHYGIQN